MLVCFLLIDLVSGKLYQSVFENVVLETILQPGKEAIGLLPKTSCYLTLPYLVIHGDDGTEQKSVYHSFWSSIRLLTILYRKLNDLMADFIHCRRCTLTALWETYKMWKCKTAQSTTCKMWYTIAKVNICIRQCAQFEWKCKELNDAKSVIW